MTGRAAPRRWIAPLVWLALAIAVAVPVAVAAASPYLAGRNVAYVVAGFAGIVSLAILLVQPLLGAGYLPGLPLPRARRWHRWTGAALVAGVGLHVGGLYLTSAPDTLDALLLVSPTPFSVYGVLAMWGVVATAGLVVLRHRLGLRPMVWRVVHNALALVVVVATAVHALQIEGTMGAGSKWALCIAVLAITGGVLFDLRVRRPLRRARA